jgi:hypothetical protein
MKTRLFTCLALAAAVLACTEIPEQTMPSFGPDPAPSPEDGNAYVTVSIPAEMAFAWKAGDAITIESASGVENFTLIPGSSTRKGLFRGKALEGASFNILIPGPQTSFEAMRATDFSKQTQAANADNSHIKPMIALKGVNTLSGATLSKDWAAEKGGEFYQTRVMTLDIQVPSAMKTLSSVSVTSPLKSFGSYTVMLPDLDMTALGHKVKAFIQFSWNTPVMSPGNTFNFTLKGGELTATRDVKVDESTAVESPSLVLDNKDWEGEGLVVSGPGTAAAPYQIASADDLMAMRDKLVENAEEPVYFQLTADIDMSGKAWTPLVTANAVYPLVFDGAGHTISHLSVTGSDKFPSFAGVLAGEIHDVVFDSPVIASSSATETGVVTGWAGRSAGDITASIYNVTVKDASITLPGSAPAGMIAGQGMKVSIRNCQAGGTIENGVSCTGGILGNIALADEGSVIEGCSFSGSINLPAAGDYNGGIIGAIRKGSKDVLISNCHVAADITSGTSKSYIGGILGANWNGNTGTVIEKCSYSGTIKTIESGNGGSGLAGICGYTQAIVIRNCRSDGTITQCNYGIGGIAGTVFENVTIENCFSSMTLHSRHGTGGIAGRADNNANASDATTGYNDTFRNCIAWNPSITSRLNIGSGNLSSGAVVGKCVSKNIHSGCIRRPDMVFECFADAAYNVLFDQEDNDASGAMPIPVSLGQYYWPYHGKAAAAGKSASDVARDLGWDTSIWDLSGAEPVLK